MEQKNRQINGIKAKAEEARKNIKPVTSKYHVYNPQTRKIEVRERVIRSGKEGNSFKRIVLIVSLIVAELVLLAFLYVLFLQAFLWFIFIPYGIGVVFACRIAVSGKNPDSKIAWILFLLILAPAAFIVYLLAGEITATPLKSRRLKKINESTKLLSKREIPESLPARVRQETHYIQNKSDYVPYFNGSAEYFSTGEDFFEDVLEKLKSAEKFIFMEYFILEEGHLANALFEILAERAKAGVDVRIITDGFGSHGTLSLLKVNRIRKQGIKIVAFEPLLPVVSFFINYRDHRKILVIDGKTGYAGGTNIADEYINAKNRFGVWKDASVRLDGAAVQGLTLLFLRMWQYSAKEKPDYETLLNIGQEPAETEGSGVIVPYADGPGEKHKLGKGVYANIIGNAQKSLYIMTPYFIIDNYIVDLLKAKAESGVDVRLLIPGIPDKKLVYALTRFNAEKLVASGVRVYIYTPGFLHSKVMLSDNQCAVVGSVNMDFRSFYQQYENAVYLTCPGTVSQIADDFTRTFTESQELTSDNLKKRNIFKRIGLSVLRLFSPLM